MSLIAQNTLSKDATFQERVRVAMAKAAVAIAGEAQAVDVDGLTHRKRHALAVAILNDPETYVARFSLACVTNEAILAGSTDGDIEYQVAAIFNDIAGVGENLG